MKVDGEGHLFLSPSDLSNFLACEYLTQIDLKAARGELRRPFHPNRYADLVARKGDEHERAYLSTLLEAGHSVVEIGLGDQFSFEAAAQRTLEAVREGPAYICQAVLTDGRWRGIADFLERVDRPSQLGPWSYEVLDAKLARHERPAHVLQLCFYAHALAQIQGVPVEQIHLMLGTRERVSLRLADFAAYYRRIQCRLLDVLAAGSTSEPYPCDRCDFCDLYGHCEKRWESEDHVLRVARIRRDQVGRLKSAGLATLTGLAQAKRDMTVPKMRPTILDGLRDQAELQRLSHPPTRIEWHSLPIEPGRGYTRLPQPSPGDIFFDFEGHPFFEPSRGLEFLFGMIFVDGEAPQYEAIWAHDVVSECRALERFVDVVDERLQRFPDLHIYHFGAYEPTAIKRLMGEHATRETQVDDLLRRGIFVDLCTIVRQGLRAGLGSYSLKDVEALAGFTRTASVRSGTEAILEYERWLQTHDATALEAIAAYNEEDCRATLALRQWLLTIRPNDLPWPDAVPPRDITQEAKEAEAARIQLRGQLLEGAEPGSPRWLAAELLEYHRREARPGWWWFFERCGMSPEELIEDPESIGCLKPDPDIPPRPYKRSTIFTLRFPPQDHKLGHGEVIDPSTGQRAGDLLSIDDASGRLELVLGPTACAQALPRALIPRKPYDDGTQRTALARFGMSLLNGTDRYPAVHSILQRDQPAFRDRVRGGVIQTTDPEEMKALALRLNESYLFIQGPPGSGKTYTGARLITHLIREGKTVGVTAQSHKAIHNLLEEIERVAAAEELSFRGLKRSTKSPESEYEGRFIHSEGAIPPFADPDPGVRLFAGTAWLFARPELDRKLDYLVIDEAGQVALADAIAMGTCARNLILLGDPLQLAQVSQGTHPPGAGVSVLEHLLGSVPTISEARGIFLERTFRMHPDVCRFISEIVYAGRLRSDEKAAQRTTAFGTGIRFIPVEHDGNRTASTEEVAAIAREIERLSGGDFIEAAGRTRPLRHEDFMVVAPYNAQVRRLREALPAGVRVGTVDKFQGQEAPVVFFSMATSSGDDVSRGLAFLFSRNRLNVAISRAQCLAILVCSPRLLEARCASVEDMQLVNALCRLVEFAAETGGDLRPCTFGMDGLPKSS